MRRRDGLMIILFALYVTLQIVLKQNENRVLRRTIYVYKARVKMLTYYQLLNRCLNI